MIAGLGLAGLLQAARETGRRVEGLEKEEVNG